MNTVSKTGISTMQAIIAWIRIIIIFVCNINFDLSNHTDIFWAFAILLTKLRLWVKTSLTHKLISIVNIVVFLGGHATNWLEHLRKNHFVLGNVRITDHSHSTFLN